MADRQGREPRVRRGIQAVTWWMWWPMSWLLPMLFCFHGVFAPDTLMAAFLMVGSVVIVPLAGVIGMLPRKLLRDRGFDSTPGPITGLLILHWWGALTVTLVATDFTWAGEPTSVLRTALRVPISEASAHAIFAVAAIVTVLTWVAMVAFALAATPSAATHRLWGALAWVAVFAGPAIVVAAVASGVAASAAEQDSAGDSRDLAISRSLDQERALVQERYTQQQERLSTVRQAIVGGVWQAQPTVIDDCYGTAGECYRIAIGYVYTPDGPVDVDDVRRIIADAGWDIVDSDDEAFGPARIEASDEAGRTLVFDDLSNGSFTLESHSASWWIAPESFRAIATGEGSPSPGELYAPDDWPELDLG